MPWPLRPHRRKSGGAARELFHVPEAGEHAISDPEAWWAAILGSGYRGTLEQLSPEHRERVKSTNLQYIRDSGIRAVEANVVYALARKV